MADMMDPRSRRPQPVVKHRWPERGGKDLFALALWGCALLAMLAVPFMEWVGD